MSNIHRSSHPVAWTCEGNRALKVPSCEASSPMQHAQWSPYDFNGGTVLGVAGKDFVVLAGDTRLSTGYSILSRHESKLHKLTDKTYLGCPGSHNDINQLRGVLSIRSQMYEHDNGSSPSTESLAQLLSNTLYYRRFFPYYAFCLLAGLDKKGRGALWSYDALGSHQRLSRGAMGSGGHLIQPLLDYLVEHEMRNDPKVELTKDQVVTLMKDAFITAGERDIYTGDSVEIVAITSSGTEVETFQLKED